jgi:hypothetical protein
MIYNKFYLNGSAISKEQYVDIVERGDLYKYDVAEREPDEVHLTYNQSKEQQYKNQQEIGVLRAQREAECFSIINRGTLWHETLTEQQKYELRTWYKSWLDVTSTKQIPPKPCWLK